MTEGQKLITCSSQSLVLRGDPCLPSMAFPRLASHFSFLISHLSFNVSIDYPKSVPGTILDYCCWILFYLHLQLCEYDCWQWEYESALDSIIYVFDVLIRYQYLYLYIDCGSLMNVVVLFGVMMMDDVFVVWWCVMFVVTKKYCVLSASWSQFFSSVRSLSLFCLLFARRGGVNISPSKYFCCTRTSTVLVSEIRTMMIMIERIRRKPVSHTIIGTNHHLHQPTFNLWDQRLVWRVEVSFCCPFRIRNCCFYIRVKWVYSS